MFLECRDPMLPRALMAQTRFSSVISPLIMKPTCIINVHVKFIRFQKPVSSRGGRRGYVLNASKLWPNQRGIISVN